MNPRAIWSRLWQWFHRSPASESGSPDEGALDEDPAGAGASGADAGHREVEAAEQQEWCELVASATAMEAAAIAIDTARPRATEHRRQGASRRQRARNVVNSDVG